MVAILFEGKSDANIINKICIAYGLPITEIKYYNFEGKDNIFNIGHKYYNELEKDVKSLQRIDKILIVVDADNESDSAPYRGFEASENKLKETIKDLDLSVSIDYYIMCNTKKEGNLESFLLSVLDDGQLDCIESFRECYKYELSDKWAYNTFYKQKNHPFDFNHDNFILLKEKLEKLFDAKT